VTPWSPPPSPGLSPATRPRPVLSQAPPPNPIAAEPDGRRVLSRGGAADHEVTPKAPLTGSGCREHSYGGFGGGHPHFHPHATPAGNPRIKRQAHPCRESSNSVRSFGLAWVFAFAAVHRDPAPSDGVAARVAAYVSLVAGPNRISSSGRRSSESFKLDQHPWPVLPGPYRTVLNATPCQDALVDAADLIWNRAALEKGGATPDVGDRALADMLAFHGLVMSGGVLDAIEQTSEPDLARIGAAFRWFGLESVVNLLAPVHRDIQAGALDELDRAEALELAADRDYQAILPSDEALQTVLRGRLDDDPSAFARM
jgi:hypothetical protein